MFLHVVQSVTIEVIQDSPQLTILKPCNFFLVVSKFKMYLEIVKLLNKRNIYIFMSGNK